MSPINVVDLFAGPGGLGEGFAAYPFDKKIRHFDINLSIEKDPIAAQTLALRSFSRQFGMSTLPDQYYDLLAKTSEPLEARLERLYSQFPQEHKVASAEAWCTALGDHDQVEMAVRLKKAIGKQKNWVLVGGPPCQAYSLVGRSRNKGINSYNADKDDRQYLYLEYLKVIADHKPAVFVMENVKGLLSATVKNERIFDRILSDLENPRSAVFGEKAGTENDYEIFSIVRRSESGVAVSLSDYVVKMEEFGVPQARHRIILLGVRKDIARKAIPRCLTPVAKPNTTKQTISGLPKRLRSGLSKRSDHADNWLDSLTPSRSLMREVRRENSDVAETVESVVATLSAPSLGRGDEYVTRRASTKSLSGDLSEWLVDENLDGTFNHSTRGHIASDLQRYLFASCFAKVEKRSPTLRDFPTSLLPNHKNVSTALSGSNFADRFRVQVANRPSRTVTCHISKDGHYYIHYDPSQCRSLTVREAARLQTFPDNYFFCGPRTKQYIQVGNAVPPFLAHQIAEIVYTLLKDANALAQ